MVKHLKQMLKHNMVDVVGGPGLERSDLKTTIWLLLMTHAKYSPTEKKIFSAHVMHALGCSGIVFSAVSQLVRVRPSEWPIIISVSLTPTSLPSILYVYIPPGRECRPKVYHVTNSLGFIIEFV